MNSSKLFKITLIVTFIAVVAKIVGFIRDMVIARNFGILPSTDAFYLAQSMPSIIFPAVCSSISTVFISQYISLKREDKKKQYARDIVLTSILLAILLSALSIIIIPFIIPIVGSGFTAELQNLVIKLSIITMGSFVLIMLQYLMSSLLNANKIFYYVQISGIVYNCFIIIPLLMYPNLNDVVTLTWLVLIAHLIQTFVLLIYSKKYLNCRKKYKAFNNEYIELIKLAMPILIGNSVIQIQNIVDKTIASNFASGSISALSYGTNLSNLVVSVFIISLSTVLYPSLATLSIEDKDYSNFSKTLNKSIFGIIIILIPISIVSFLFSTEIVQLVYERGAFGDDATKITSGILKYFSIGFIFIAIREVISRAFYAKNNTKTPMINGIISVFINIFLSIILSKKMGINGIVFATSIASIISAILISCSLSKKMKISPFKENFMFYLKLGAASTVTFLLSSHFKIQVFNSILFNLIINTIIVFLIYIILLLTFKIDFFKIYNIHRKEIP